MKPYIIFFLTFFPFLQASQATASYCGFDSIFAARDHASSIVGHLEIASYRGDIDLMTEKALELSDFLETCGDSDYESDGTFSCMRPDYKLTIEEEDAILDVCDQRCHSQLIRYHNFMAGDFLFMQSHENDDGTQLVNLINLAKDHADLCSVQLSKRGLKAVSRQQNLCLAAGAGEAITNTIHEGCTPEAQDSAFETYIRQAFHLKRLRIEALLASADISYQSSSDLALKKIIQLVDETLDNHKEEDNTIKMAADRYRRAQWLLIDMRTSVPNSARFGTLHHVMDQLEFAIKQRNDSIENGYLFLNIDPDKFVTMNMDDLKSRLDELNQKVRQVEISINQLRIRGQAEGNSDEITNVDEQRFISNADINVKSHQIMALQDMAQKHSLILESSLQQLDSESLGYETDILEKELSSGEINKTIAQLESIVTQLKGKISSIHQDKVDVQGDILDVRSRIHALENDQIELQFSNETRQSRQKIRQLEFELRRDLLNMEYEKKKIENIKEKDLIALNRQRILASQAKYKWLVNFEITNLNLDLQLKSLGSQIYNYAKGIKDTIDDVRTLLNRASAMRSEYMNLNTSLRQKELKILSKVISHHSNELYSRLSDRSKICNLQRKLEFLGVPQNSYTPYGPAHFYQTGRRPENDEDVISSTIDELRFTPVDDQFRRELFSDNPMPDQCNYHDLLEKHGVHSTLSDNLLPEVISSEILPFAPIYDSASSIHVFELFNKTDQETLTENGLSLDLNELIAMVNKPCDTQPAQYTAQQYYTEMCGNDSQPGLRQELIDSQIDFQQLLEDCILADTPSSSCQTNTNIVTIVERIYEQQRRTATAELKALADQIARLSEFKSWLQIESRTYSTLVNGLQAALRGAASTSVAASKISTTMVSTGTSGQGAHKVTTVIEESSRAASETFDTMQAITSLVVGSSNFEILLQEKIQRIITNINALEANLTVLESRSAEITLAKEQTMVEIAGKRLAAEHQQTELRLQEQILTADCDNNEQKWLDQVDSAIAEHQWMLANLSRYDGQQHLSQIEIDALYLQITQLLRQQEIIRNNTNSVNIEISKKRREAISFQHLIENTTEQMCRIEQTKSTITDQNEELDDIQIALELIDDAMEKQIISGSEISHAHLKATIEESESQIDELIKFQQEGLDLAEQSYSNQLGILNARNEILTFEKFINSLNQEVAQLDNLGQNHREKISLLTESVRDLATQALELRIDNIEVDQHRVALRSQMIDFRDGINDKITTLRSEIIDEIRNATEKTDGVKEYALLNSRQAVAAMEMGVPEYIQVKKRLVQRANIYLNFLRSKLNTLTGLNSDGENILINSRAYIRSSFGLDSAIEQLSLSLSESDISLIKGNTTSIQIPVDSPLFQNLLRTGRASFQVGYIPSDSEESLTMHIRHNGYRTLWSKNFEVSNARLLDVLVSGGHDCPDLNAINYSIHHQGQGFVFVPLYSGSDILGAHFESKGPRSLHTMTLRTEGDSDWESFSENWMRFAGGQTLYEFEENLNARDSAGNKIISGRFLGMPLAGHYEITLDMNAKCERAFANHNLKIHFNFSKDAL